MINNLKATKRETKTTRELNALRTKGFIPAVLYGGKIPNLNICAHLIFGIPGESNQQLVEAANLLNELLVDGVKLHNLHVLKNTPLAEEYNCGNFSPIDLQEYAERVVLFLENLDQKISIYRLTAVAPRWDELIAPQWTKEKMRPVQYIENLLATNETWQGRMLDSVS